MLTAAGCRGAQAATDAGTLEVRTVATDRPLPSAGRLGGVSVDREGNVYVSNFGASVWRVRPDGEVDRLAADLRGSSGNAIVGGRLLQASFSDNRIVAIAPDGTMTLFAAGGMNGPIGLVGDHRGRVYVCSCRDNSVAVIEPDGQVRTLARGGRLDCPNGITLAPDGSLAVVSFNNSDVVSVSPEDGAMRTLAVLPPGRNAHITFAAGSFYVTRIEAGELYRVGMDGRSERVIGGNGIGLTDGPPESARLAYPNGIATGPDGRYLYMNNLRGPWRSDQDTEMVIRRVGPLDAPGIERIGIHVGDLVFDARAAGPRNGPVVLLLHGFPETSYAFRHQLTALAALGFRAVAPDQRGYSPGARPADVEAYAMAKLTEDVVEIADALGADRFDLVGHDWGGAVAWVVATRFPDRVRTLTVLSTPHYAALSAARAEIGSDQAERSSYFSDFAVPGAAERLLDDDASGLRALYGDLDPSAVSEYLRVLGNPDALRAALAWYAAAFGPGSPSGTTSSSPARPAPVPVPVPTLYVWSTGDRAFGRAAAEATRDFVAGPYRLVVIESVDHWVAERAPEEVSRLIAEQILAHR